MSKCACYLLTVLNFIYLFILQISLVLKTPLGIVNGYDSEPNEIHALMKDG